MNSIVSQYYNTDNDIWGLPQIYKGIEFHPIKIKETKLKEKMHKIFSYPKSHIADRDILRMSYLKFLLYALYINSAEFVIEDEILSFLKAITKRDNITYEYKECPEQEDIFDKVSIFINIDGQRFTEDDFNNIREIVLEQNGSSIEYVEEYNPELEKKLAFMQRNLEDMDFKDEIFSFCALTGLSEIEAGEKTLYQFKCRFEREMMIKEYSLFKPLEVSGQISAKNGKDELFKHYLRHIGKSGRYDSIFMDQQKFLDDSGLSNPNSEILFE